MKTISIIIATFITSSFLCQVITAQPVECGVLKSYHVNDKTVLSISNKFGKITLVNGSTDSVTICGTVEVNHINNKMAKMSMELIKMDIGFSDNIISVKTSYNESFFSSNTAEGREGFNTSYMIKVPANINLKIDNSFGNVTLENITGHVDISIAHGTLTARSLSRGSEKPVSNIILRHADAKIDKAGWLGWRYTTLHVS
jgi:hypothetical protein